MMWCKCHAKRRSCPSGSLGEEFEVTPVAHLVSYGVEGKRLPEEYETARARVLGKTDAKA